MKNISSYVMKTYGRYKLTIDHGKGCRLYDSAGREYLDFGAGIATCILGHGNQRLKTAVSNQMDKVHHCSNLYFIPEQAELAKWLVESSCMDKVFFCNSGAEANEAAIKLARKYAHTKLDLTFPIIITAVNSFHGRTLTAITATGQPKYQKDFGPLTPGFEYVTYNNPDELENLVNDIQARGNGQGLAAIMIESVQGEGGVLPATNEFMSTIRRLCDKTKAVMIIDEVQTGICRTGKMWGYENFDIEPDVITSAKALGGGVPIGAMLCKEQFNVFNPGDHASTYGGNALACAAGLAVADAIKEDNILKNVQERSEQFRQLTADLKEKFPSIVEGVRGLGLLSGLKIRDDSNIVSSEIASLLLEEGVLVVPAGLKVVRFIPPLIVTKEEMQEAMLRLEKVLKLVSDK